MLIGPETAFLPNNIIQIVPEQQQSSPAAVQKSIPRSVQNYLAFNSTSGSSPRHASSAEPHPEEQATQSSEQKNSPEVHKYSGASSTENSEATQETSLSQPQIPLANFQPVNNQTATSPAEPQISLSESYSVTPSQEAQINEPTFSQEATHNQVASTTSLSSDTLPPASLENCESYSVTPSQEAQINEPTFSQEEQMHNQVETPTLLSSDTQPTASLEKNDQYTADAGPEEQVPTPSDTCPQCVPQETLSIPIQPICDPTSTQKEQGTAPPSNSKDLVQPEALPNPEPSCCQDSTQNNEVMLPSAEVNPVCAPAAQETSQVEYIQERVASENTSPMAFRRSTLLSSHRDSKRVITGEITPAQELPSQVKMGRSRSGQPPVPQPIELSRETCSNSESSDTSFSSSSLRSNSSSDSHTV